jgi:hypothetical protein
MDVPLPAQYDLRRAVLLSLSKAMTAGFAVSRCFAVIPSTSSASRGFRVLGTSEATLEELEKYRILRDDRGFRSLSH